MIFPVVLSAQFFGELIGNLSEITGTIFFKIGNDRLDNEVLAFYQNFDHHRRVWIGV